MRPRDGDGFLGGKIFNVNLDFKFHYLPGYFLRKYLFVALN